PPAQVRRVAGEVGDPRLVLPHPEPHLLLGEAGRWWNRPGRILVGHASPPFGVQVRPSGRTWVPGWVGSFACTLVVGEYCGADDAGTTRAPGRFFGPVPLLLAGVVMGVPFFCRGMAVDVTT